MSRSTPISTATIDSLGHAQLLAWQAAHGTLCGTAHAVLGQESLSVILERAFSPAERKIAQCEKGRQLLTNYAKRLMQPICQQEAQRITAVLNTHITHISIHVDPIAGCLMLIFSLTNSYTKPATP